MLLPSERKAAAPRITQGKKRGFHRIDQASASSSFDRRQAVIQLRARKAKRRTAEPM
jgi:hypothetical protein